LPLILAAEARGDQTEHGRLCASAPVKVWRFPDYLMGSLVLNVLALIYITEQLDYLANYWHAVWRLGDPDDPAPTAWLFPADVAAYVFTCNAHAWRQFCGEVHIDADQLTAGNHAGWMLAYGEAQIPQVAPTRNTLMAHLRERGVEDPQPITEDDLLARWRNRWQSMTRHAPLGAEKGKR